MRIFSALAKQPKGIQAAEYRRLISDGESEHDKDVTRKRERRSKAAEITIPAVKDIVRRERALDDPERFLRTYFADRYRLAFGKDHLFMIDAICSRARHGGSQAVAAPRGRGKSELVKGLMVYLVLAGLVRFPLPVAATSALAGRLYEDFRKKIGTNELLLDDFPEVCYPVRALEGAPQRAAKQHINGRLTNIVWTGHYLRLADVPGSIYGGVKMSYYGLDSAFRGANIDGDRPDFILIDDPETRESAKSIGQIEDREAIIDQDIAGLVSQEETLAVVVLTTVQNSYCLSYKLTDRAEKPSMNGVRFGMIVEWPKRLDMWEEYVSIRHASQTAGDEHGLKAVEFYLANREAIDEGVEMISDHYVRTTLEDGTEAVHSAIQQAYNKIADTSMEAYKTEYQNDPEPEEQADSAGLTAGMVASRQSGYLQNEMPPLAEWVTVGLDIGKHASHWAKIAWWGNAIGTVIDYGVMETWGLTNTSDNQSIEKALLSSLHQWRTDITAQHPPLICLIDSGAYTGKRDDSNKGMTHGVYAFCRDAGKPFYAAKGFSDGRFRLPERAPEKIPFLEAYASHLKHEGLWLYNINTEWWKEWLQQRFITPTFDDSQRFNDGSLSVFSCPTDKRRHLSFSKHIVSEERRTMFVQGRGNVSKWEVLSRNNHWLDAVALACAAAGCAGVRLLQRPQPAAPSRPQQPKPRLLNPAGQPFLATERR